MATRIIDVGKLGNPNWHYIRIVPAMVLRSTTGQRQEETRKGIVRVLGKWSWEILFSSYSALTLRLAESDYSAGPHQYNKKYVELIANFGLFF